MNVKGEGECPAGPRPAGLPDQHGMSFKNLHPGLRPLGVDKETGRQRFELLEDFVWTLNCHTEVTVKAGYVCDGASIPSWCWRFGFHPTGEYFLSSIVHDYLCDNRTEASRFWADCTFREAMRTEGVATWKRVLMYYAVRAFAVWQKLRGQGCTGEWS